jgi:oxygen-independent coproporphyrinogen-3 oxidase
MKHENTFERNRLFDVSVPRYTSYPPANRFIPIEDSALEASWLGAVPIKTELSFYIHIPFCKRLCWFCACRTQGSKTLRPIEAYVQKLKSEIDMKVELLPDGISMSRLHLGGGTPTILPPNISHELLRYMTSAVPFASDFEFSVEIDPTDCDIPRMDVLRDFGMNRASIGVQDFDENVQAAIGRLQSFDQTKFCMDHLRKIGVKDINLDILYGLPYQTEQSLLETVEQVLELNPSRIAAFGYAHVPWMSKRQALINTSQLPDTRQRLHLFQVMAERLMQEGYIQIGIDHFVKPNDPMASALQNHTLRRNFQGYTDDNSQYLIGIGASSISKYPQGYLQNTATTSRYQLAIEDGKLCAERGFVLQRRDKTMSALIEQLMCYGRLDPNFLPVTDATELTFVHQKIDELARAYPEIVERSGTRLHVPSKYFPMLRILAAKLENSSSQPNTNSLAI